MYLPDIKRITIDNIHLPFLENKKVQLDMLRLDKIHPVISGNKWFKLNYHLENFATGNYKGILTFGGAWSNHIVATACAAYLQKIDCVGIIRGEQPSQLSLTLHDAIKYKMKLKFVSREIYRQKNNDDFISLIKEEFPDYYIIPEGGAGDVGEKGVGEILQFAPDNNYSHIACAVGTGTMFNGLTKTAESHQRLLGIVVLKGWNEIVQSNICEFINNYHFGGYAKHDATLLSFMNDLYSQTNIPTDFVYTGKLAFAIVDLVKKDHFNAGSKILMIHSGGLQGNVSLQKGSLIF